MTAGDAPQEDLTGKLGEPPLTAFFFLLVGVGAWSSPGPVVVGLFGSSKNCGLASGDSLDAGRRPGWLSLVAEGSA